MKLLIIGGTAFLGRHYVEAALARGDEVTMFNRGQTNPDIYPNVERLHGDRTNADDVRAAFNGRRWDVVVDTSGYLPDTVRLAAETLADKADYYVFVSSISAYADNSQPGFDENTAVQTLEDETVTEVTPTTYGGLKVLCERAAEAAFPNRALHVRAGMIIGAYDNVGRFPYWVRRIDEGGEVLAPGNPDARVQVIDARDIADWSLRMADVRKGGAYNITGPDYPLTMRDLLETCRTVSRSNATFTWASDDFLIENEVPLVEGLPYWLPVDKPEFADYRAFFQVGIDKALADGLTFRPLADTVRETLEWIRTGEAVAPKSSTRPQPGPLPEREAELLQKWHSRGNTAL